MNRCRVCGTRVDEDDWSVCEDCREKAKTLDNAYSMGRSWREEVSINGFWRTCFTDEEIDDIFYAYFKSLSEEEQKKLIDKYCDYDTLYFVRWITEKCKEEE